MRALLPSLVPVVAHQGGWDEVLIFGIPVVLAIGAVRWAEKRARARREDERPAPDQEGRPAPDG
jgi:hypothetical protein